MAEVVRSWRAIIVIIWAMILLQLALLLYAPASLGLMLSPLVTIGGVLIMLQTFVRNRR